MCIYCKIIRRDKIVQSLISMKIDLLNHQFHPKMFKTIILEINLLPFEDPLVRFACILWTRYHWRSFLQSLVFYSKMGSFPILSSCLLVLSNLRVVHVLQPRSLKTESVHNNLFLSKSMTLFFAILILYSRFHRWYIQ